MFFYKLYFQSQITFVPSFLLSWTEDKTKKKKKQKPKKKKQTKNKKKKKKNKKKKKRQIPESVNHSPRAA